METTVLIAAISALAAAVATVAKTAYTEMRTERDYLREQVLSTLIQIVTKAAETTDARDRMVRELNTKLDNIRRMLNARGAGK